MLLGVFRWFIKSESLHMRIGYLKAASSGSLFALYSPP